jgi:hypothetical protein
MLGEVHEAAGVGDEARPHQLANCNHNSYSQQEKPGVSDPISIKLADPDPGGQK